MNADNETFLLPAWFSKDAFNCRGTWNLITSLFLLGFILILDRFGADPGIYTYKQMGHPLVKREIKLSCASKFDKVV